jgi:hypothetical protein
VSGLGSHLGREEAPHPLLVFDPEEPEQPLVSSFPPLADQVLEQDNAEAVGRNRERGAVGAAMDPGLDRAQPVGPPADRGADPARAPGLAGHRGGRIPAVPERVDEPRLGEQAQQRLGGADVVGRHLDQARLPVPFGDRPEQVEIELPATANRVVGVGGLEALERPIELRLPEQVVEPARLPVDADTVPPEAAQLGEVGLQRDPTLEQIGHAALVAVEPRLDRHVGQPAVAAEQLGYGMGARSPRAPDEDEVGPAHAGCCS